MRRSQRESNHQIIVIIIIIRSHFWLKPQSLSTVPGLLLGLTTQVHQRYQTDSCIEVAPYKHGKLFSMDNRRLYCVKENFSAGKMIWVKMYPSIAAYDADHPKSTSWGSKFSTINDGVSVVLLPRGFGI